MKVITVANRKGGVGKTTIVTHLSAGLATLGYNVGMVDADSQGNLSEMFGIEQDNSLFRVMVESSPLETEVVKVAAEYYSTPDRPSQGNLYLIRGGDRTYKIPFDMAATDILGFADKMRQFGDLCKLDYLVIDTQPTMSQFDGSVYLATDGFLYVTEVEALAMKGLVHVIEQAKQFNATRQRFMQTPSKIIGIIPNKMRTNTITHQENIGFLAQEFGMFKDGGLVMPPLRLLTVWTQASQERVPMYVFLPTGEAADDAWKIVNSVRERLEAWQAT